MEQLYDVESRKRFYKPDRSLSDDGYDSEVLGDPAFHSTPMPAKRARYMLGEIQENNIQQEDFDINVLENEFEQKRNSNQQIEHMDDSDPEQDVYEECSWIQQKNFRKDRYNGYLENKSKKRVQFVDTEITPYITGRQIRHTPSTPTPADSSTSELFEPPVLSPFLNSNLVRTFPVFNAHESTPFTPAQKRTSLSSSIWNTPNTSLRSYASSPSLTSYSLNSSLSNASPSKRSSKPSPLHSGSQTVSENYVEEEPKLLPLILEVEDSFHLNRVSKKRHAPKQPETTFDISTGTVLPAFCPQTVSWNKRLNLVAFQWETGIAFWNPKNEDFSPMPLTKDVGYEFKIKQMSWNHSYTTLAMLSCRGDLMLWNSLTGRRSQAKPLPKSSGVSMKLLLWKPFVPEMDDVEALYIMTKQGMLFEFKVHMVKVEAVRCVKAFLTDPECLTISQDNKYIACTNIKGCLGLWKVAQSLGEVSGDFVYKKDLGEIHSWCPWKPMTMVTASRKDKSLKIFSQSEKRVISSTTLESPVTSMSWSRDFQELITAEWCHIVCRSFPEMTKTMSVNVSRPMRSLDVREADDSCLMTLNNKGLIEMWRCFDREDNGYRYLSSQTQSRRQAMKAPWLDDNSLASDLSGCSLR